LPTHRERVAEAPTMRRIANALLGWSLQQFPHLAILPGRCDADASRTRRRRDIDASDATPTRRRRIVDMTHTLLTRRERVTYSTRRRRVANIR